MSEIFNEIDEDLRREQLRKLWEKYSLVLIAGAILIIAAVAGWRSYQYFEAKKAAEAGSAFESAVTLSEQGKSAEAEAAFAKIGSESSSGYRGLARLRAAAEAAKLDPQRAVKLYDGLASDGSVTAAEQDMARLRAANILIDSAPYEEVRKRLEPSSDGSHTFRHSARELLALSAWKNNNAEAARQWLNVIANDPQSPPTIRNRAEAIQALLPPVAKS